MPRKKQSFIQTLAKGFVRSAINQVGRDSGRLVSNKLYKGAHATPVNLQQTASPPQPQTRTQKEMQHINPNAMYYEGQFYIVSGIEPMFTFEMLGSFIIAFIYPPYGITIICLYALMHYINKEVKVKIQTDNGLVPATIQAQKPQDLHINKLKALLLTLTTLPALISYYTDWLK